MNFKHGAIIAFAVALIPMGFVAYFVHRDLTAAQRADAPTSYGGATVGDRQLAILAQLTKSYVASDKDGVTPAMRAGTELAPPAFLNEELKQRGAKWRVREVRGLVADTYVVA